MKYEIENIFPLSEWKQLIDAPFPIYQHKINSQILIAQTGIGKTNAASATQYMLDMYKTPRFINLGAVGCLNPDIKIGEVCAVSGCRFFDVDVTAFDYKLGQVPECSLVEYGLQHDQNLPRVKLLTGDRFVSDPASLQAILKEYKADFIDMEGAAIAHTLYRNGRLDQLESYKAPSDYCNGASAKNFYANEQLAFANLRTLANTLVHSLGTARKDSA